MCRAGGRRCPSHSDPLKVAEYNTVRRQRYAAGKEGTSEGLTPETRNYTDYGFLDIKTPRPFRTAEQEKEFMEDADEFRKEVWPDYSDDAWGAMLDNEDWMPEESELGALTYYTSYGHNETRLWLEASPEKFAEAEGDFYAQMYPDIIHNLDSAIRQKLPDDKKRTVYRGMKIHQINIGDDVKLSDYLKEKFPVGGVISQKNYMSTTESFDTASSFSGAQHFGADEEEHSFIFEIITKQGVPLGKGVSTREYDEAEVLMPRDAKFKVVAVHPKVHVQGADPLGPKFNRPMKAATVIQLVDVDNEGE